MARFSILPMIALLTGAFAGCTPDFDDEWLVVDLRILALRVTPPEIRITADQQQIGPLEFDSLIVNPADQDDQKPYRWELWLCTAEEATCAEAPNDERLMLKSDQTPLAAIREQFTIDRELYNKALARDLFAGLGGIAIMAELRIVDDTRAGETATQPPQVVGVKRIVIAESEKTVGNPNNNPELTVTLDGNPLCPGCELTEVDANTELVLMPDPGTTQETYQLPTLSGGFDLTQTADLDEKLTYHFFVTAGDLSRARTGGENSVFVDIKTTRELFSVWTSPSAESSETTIWVVARDDRGGTDWVSGTLKILP